MPLWSKNQSDISIMRKLCYTWHSKIWRHIIMIAYISGALVSAGENYIVIDNHGMGYRIFVSGKFLEHIPAYGTQIKIYTHMYIRRWIDIVWVSFRRGIICISYLDRNQRGRSESRYGNPYSSYDPGASARGDQRMRRRYQKQMVSAPRVHQGSYWN